MAPVLSVGHLTASVAAEKSPGITLRGLPRAMCPGRGTCPARPGGEATKKCPGQRGRHEGGAAEDGKLGSACSRAAPSAAPFAVVRQCPPL